MKLGIIGKPQSGKTTVFNVASQHHEVVGDYSRTAHRAVIRVPDRRVDELARLIKPERAVYAEIEFLDAPGFTGKGKESAGPEITPELHTMDALILVVDCFSSVANVEKDIRDMLDEMILADQVVIESSLEKKARKMKLAGDKSAAHEIELLHKCGAGLEQGKLLIDLDFSEDEQKTLRGFAFLTQKPLLIVMNIAEGDLRRCAELIEELSHYVAEGKRDITALCGEIEMELLALDEDERKPFMDELGIAQPAVQQVIQKAYSMLGLISFITVTGPEVRAWTVRSGTSAHRAAGVVHSDMERGFIRAEVIKYDDFIQHQTPAAVKAAGKARLEGKDYIVQDGDVILFRFNV
ncbi:MAG: redox-regulated ATPase YchF [Candidatus Zixiibacteriota bacterium]|nr:MAG: redox-regulated ATPase YchF [candidate division Zixibacteria bacterium]